MRPIVLQFGAGNIGRGFLAQLFHDSGMEVIFVEYNPELVSIINSRKSYPLTLLSSPIEVVTIDHVRAIHSANIDAIAEVMADAELAATAVGAAALPLLAPALAAGLLARYKKNNRPINILICENLHGAAQLLKEAVESCLSPEISPAIMSATGFAQTVVSRMVPLLTEEERKADPLQIRTEPYSVLPVDSRPLAGSLPLIKGLQPASNFEALEARKLFTHNGGHAALGYLGLLKGYTFGWEALEDPYIFGILQGMMHETGEALVQEYGFSSEEQHAHEQDLLARFSNKALGDTCSRLARDPIRKLAPDDRLIGAARLCESFGIVPTNTAMVIAAALLCDLPSDLSSQELKRRIQLNGIERTLSEISQLGACDPLIELIIEDYSQLSNPFKEFTKE